MVNVDVMTSFVPFCKVSRVVFNFNFASFLHLSSFSFWILYTFLLMHNVAWILICTSYNGAWIKFLKCGILCLNKIIYAMTATRFHLGISKSNQKRIQFQISIWNLLLVDMLLNYYHLNQIFGDEQQLHSE